MAVVDIEDVVEEIASVTPNTLEWAAEAISRLYTLYYFKGTSLSFTFLYFKSLTEIPQAVEFAKRYCVTNLNARFLRVEPAVHVID